MISLSTIACVLGAFIAVVNVLPIAAPEQVRRWAAAFPRSKGPAWALTAIDLTWVSWVILHASLGRFEVLKPAVYAAGPISFILIVVFMDELLAPRALGGLLLLIANPVLNAARWLDTEWRLVMVVVAYIWVIIGIMLVLSPFYFRKGAEVATKTDFRCRVGGIVRMLAGLFILFLGLKVY